MVQYVLEQGDAESSRQVLEQLRGHFAELAMQKFSSNVVEKCIKLGGRDLDELRDGVIREIILSPKLPQLLQVHPSYISSSPIFPLLVSAPFQRFQGLSLSN